MYFYSQTSRSSLTRKLAYKIEVALCHVFLQSRSTLRAGEKVGICTLIRIFTVRPIDRVWCVNSHAKPMWPFGTYFYRQNIRPRPRRRQNKVEKYTLTRIFTVELAGRVWYVNLHTKSTSQFDMYFYSQSLLFRVKERVKKLTLIHMFTVEPIGRVWYVISHTESRSQFDVFLQPKSASSQSQGT